jgi:hypothetical protein
MIPDSQKQKPSRPDVQAHEGYMADVRGRWKIEGEEKIRTRMNSWNSEVDCEMLRCEGGTTWEFAAGPLFSGYQPLPRSNNGYGRIISAWRRVSRKIAEPLPTKIA